MTRTFAIIAFSVALSLSAAVLQAAVAHQPGPDREVAAKAGPIPPELRRAFEGVVREYLLKNPEIIREAMQVLQAQAEADKQEAAGQALKQHRDELLQNADSPVGGNSEGDITVVKFFDYNCGYCKTVSLTVAAVLKNDANVRVVYKEFAILGPQSLVAARAALAAKRQGKYHEFHAAMMSSVKANENSVAGTASDLGLDYNKLLRDMEDPAISEHLERNYRLATEIGINGTPAFVIGDRVVSGAIDERALMEIIAESRAKMKAAPKNN
ncbi:MAG: hypothetical protein CMM16_03590 [Rhodospirillaceae bacterium]|nr:hypothetical protein [Rhodospirillaceae bacterium]